MMALLVMGPPYIVKINMNKIKILLIVLGILLSSGIGLFVLYYEHGVREKETLHQELNQLRETIDETKVEGANTEIEQAQEDTVAEEVINTSPPPVVFVDPNPIVDCLKDKCGTKKITKSACETIVCCEIKNSVYKWADNSNECDLLKLENARQPITLPHNGQVLYCDESSHDAIKQASENIEKAKKAGDECLKNQTDCRSKIDDEIFACYNACIYKYTGPDAIALSNQCDRGCESAYASGKNLCYAKYGSSTLDCLGDGSKTAALNKLIDKYCD